MKRYNENKAQQKTLEVKPVNPVNNVQTPVQSTLVNPQPISDIPEVEVPKEPSIPNSDIIADSNLNEYANSNVNNVAPQPTMASAITQDVKPVNNQTHFAQIVKLLRDCADQIEQNGYYVNVDEMDLGNQYKVTFTINKE